MTNTNTATLTIENITTKGKRGPLFLGFKKQEDYLYSRNGNIAITATSGQGGTNLSNVILIQTAHRLDNLDNLVFVGVKTTGFRQFIEKGAKSVTEPEDVLKKLKEMSCEVSDTEQVLYIDNIDYFLDKTNHSILPFLLDLITRRNVQVITCNHSHSKLHNLFTNTLDATENLGEFVKESESENLTYKIQVPFVDMSKY